MHLITKIYTQEPHSAIETDKEPTLKLELVDAGAGEYLVIHAVEWAIDGRDEIAILYEEMVAMLNAAKKDEQ